MKTEDDYRELEAALCAVERNHDGVFLADEGFDEHNVRVSKDSPKFWDQMYEMAVQSAIERAGEAGLDLNSLINIDI
jgi:hypothetical protein